MAQTPAPLRDRLEANSVVLPWSGCWVWMGATKPNARYPHAARAAIQVDGGSRSAARVSYTVHKGPIPTGIHVLHTCDTPLCVNPDHLFLGTHKDNMRDMKRKNRFSRSSLGKTGESAPNVKLTDADITKMKRMRAQGNTLAHVAETLGCSQAWVSRVTRGEKRGRNSGR